ncbi:MAG TPA: glycosyl hydrolase family 8 [Acidimicrobiales bacterium]|nr:glycosyl hydrolase family 8 [Acidimicrobiales bacterium]
MAAVVVLALVLVGVGLLGNARSTSEPGLRLEAVHASGGAAGAAIDAFFDRYVQDDGRVVRHDQGGDTVSEGQAYALLLAVAEGDRARFDRVWRWTRTNLQRPDGLLSWKWREGRVIDDSPATDADLDSARALVLAGRRFHTPALTAAGSRIARAVLDQETRAFGTDKLLVLVAGPWARKDGVVNPSYVSPCTYEDLDAASGDGRWRRLRDSGYAMVDAFLADGRLPPDWGRAEGAEGAVRPSGPPDQPGAEPRYGADASRLAFRLSEACDTRGPALATRLWKRLEDLDGGGAALAYGLDGRRLDEGQNPVGLVAAAAAALAAGRHHQARRLLAEATDLDRRYPTYYGSAWVALGHTMFASGPHGGDG